MAVGALARFFVRCPPCRFFILRFQYRNAGSAFRWRSAHGRTDPSVRLSRWLMTLECQEAQTRAQESLDLFQHHLPPQIHGRWRNELRPGIDTSVDAADVGVCATTTATTPRGQTLA